MDINLTMPRANIQFTTSFHSLSGTSPPFNLSYGFYYVDFDAADPNAGTTVSVLDNTGATLVTVGPNITGNLIGGPAGGAGFQVGPTNGSGMAVVAANGIAASVVIQG